MANIVTGETLREAREQLWAAGAVDIWAFLEQTETLDEELGKRRPFPVQFPHLHKVHDLAEKHDRVLYCKSRRMQVSMYFVGRTLKNAFYAGSRLPGTHEIFRGAYSAIDEDLMKYQMSRISELYYSLPAWMQAKNPLIKDNEDMKVFKNGGVIDGFAMKKEGAQGRGYTEYLFDEMAWQEFARTCWRGVVPTIGRGKLFGVSTPNGKEGKGGLFYECFVNPDNLPQYRDFARMKLMWYENPEHDDEWFKLATIGMKRQEIAQMYECSFVSYAGQVVWDRFDHRIHVSKEKLYPLPGRPILIGWDLGRHPACTFWQVDNNQVWRGIGEVVAPLKGADFSEFCHDALLRATATYDRSQFDEIHGIPPDAKTRYRTKAVSGAKMDMDEIRRIWDRRRIGKSVNQTFQEADTYQCHFVMGYPQAGTRTNEKPRMKLVRRLWMLKTGEPAIILDPDMQHFIDGCSSGYVFDEKGEVPIENEYTHDQDSFQMIVSGYSRSILGETTEEEQVKKPQRPFNRLGFRTGM